MTDDDYKDLIHSHDKDIASLVIVAESLAKSQEQVHSSMSNINDKLEVMLEIMAKINLQDERIESLKNEIKDSFNHRDKELLILSKRICSIENNGSQASDMKLEKLKTKIEEDTGNLKDDLQKEGMTRLKSGLIIAFTIFSPLILGSYYYTFDLHDKLDGLKAIDRALEIKVIKVETKIGAINERINRKHKTK